MNTYLTIDKETSEEIVEKKSRFIAYVKNIETEEEAIDFIKTIKSQNHDARHNVFAYILKDGNKKYSDDGEPQGTAGIPILDMLQKENLVDIVVVVTRYFGGILLGTGGLVRAYSQSAKNAIQKSGICEMEKCFVCSLKCTYTQYGKIPSIISSNKAFIDNTDFSDFVNVDFHIPVMNFNKFSDDITEFSSGNIEIDRKSEKFYKK